MTGAIHRLPAHRWLGEPELAFHPERSEDRSIHPLKGLVQFGPFSRSLVNNVLDPIRVGVVAPQGGRRLIDGLLSELERQHRPRERFDYLPEFPGFSRVFGLRAVTASSNARIELPRSLDGAISESQTPHLVLAESLTQTLSALQAHRNDFDVLMIYLPDKWQAGFFGSSDEDFDLHDYIKAVTAVRGIPTQIIREEKALRYPCRCSVMWRLGIALYCKAGGVPWKLANAEPDMAYIGLSYALRSATADNPRFITWPLC